MELLYKLCFVLFVTALYVYFFKKASGALNLKMLNLPNLCFLYLTVYCVIGGSIVFLGFREHYLIEKVSAENINKTYWILAYTVVILPLFISLFNRAMGVKNYKTFYNSYIQKKADFSLMTSNAAFVVVALFACIGFFAILYTLYYIGYIPILELLKGNTELANERVNISRDFAGNVYIRNIFALDLVPYLSYTAYSFYRCTKHLKWKILFSILFLLSIICKTYSFEKAPVIIYVCFFLLIEVMIGTKINFKKILKYGVFTFSIILIAYYFVLDYKGKLFTLSSGPVSRVLLGQISTLFLHIQAFPNRHAYLAGASFSRLVGGLFHLPQYGIRSGRVVMGIYNARGVENGTAGVMNTLFVGEAYANWGFWGVIMSPIIVAFFLSVIPTFILKHEKEPINITIYVMLAYLYTTALVGGFVDFIYNSTAIIMIFMLLLIKILSSKGKLKI